LLIKAILTVNVMQDEDRFSRPPHGGVGNPRPNWPPAFPGYAGDSHDVEYITTYRPITKRPSTLSTTTTIKAESVSSTTTKKPKWYNRFGNFIKKQYAHISNKIG